MIILIHSWLANIHFFHFTGKWWHKTDYIRRSWTSTSRDSDVVSGGP